MHLPPRIIDLKTILWWIMVALQLLGVSVLRSMMLSSSSDTIPPGLSEYSYLAFEFNVVFAFLFVLNYLIRQFFVINDTSYYRISRLNLQIQIQYTIDIICIIVALIYTVIGARLLFLI